MAASRPSLVEPLRILVVDDFQPFRGALRTLFGQFTLMEVVGEAADGNAAIEMAFRLVPEAIIMDVKMPRLNGMEATRRIKRILPDVHVVGVSSQDEKVTHEGMIAAGCGAFIIKDCAHTLPDVLAKLTGRSILEKTFDIPKT